MGKQEIKCNALIADFQGKIEDLQSQIAGTTDAKTRSRLEDELFQMRKLVLNLRNFPERVFSPSYRLT